MIMSDVTAAQSGRRNTETIVRTCALCLCGALWLWGAQGYAESGVETSTFTYDAGGRRDPFVSLVRGDKLISVLPGSGGDGSKPVLYGILWDPDGKSIALINDLEAKTGDAVEGYLVKEIRQDAVVLDGGGELMVLRIDFDAPQKAIPDAERGGEKR